MKFKRIIVDADFCIKVGASQKYRYLEMLLPELAEKAYIHRIVYDEIMVPACAKEQINMLVQQRVLEIVDENNLEAAEKIKRKYPKSMFWIVGPLDQRISCINEKDLRDYVDRGIVDYFGEREDVRPYLEKCRIFVLPSYREGIPRSVLEAMSVGRAIITTDVPGCKETVQSYRNGILVPAENNGALAEAMKWMIEHPEIAEMMGDLSFKLAKKRYDVNKVNKEMINIMKL